MHRAEPQQAGLGRDLLALIDRFNRAKDGTMVVPSEYFEIVIAKGIAAIERPLWVDAVVEAVTPA